MLKLKSWKRMEKKNRKEWRKKGTNRKTAYINKTRKKLNDITERFDTFEYNY